VICDSLLLVSGMPVCPVPPTDTVFSLDFHTEVTPQILQKMREMVTVVVNVTKIRDNDFPSGARGIVVSYTLPVHNLVCFSESCNKDKHLRGHKYLNSQRSSSGHNIGKALRLLPETFSGELPKVLTEVRTTYFSQIPSQICLLSSTAVLK